LCLTHVSAAQQVRERPEPASSRDADKLADALATTVDFLLTGNSAEEMPLSNVRLFKRFKAVEDFDGEDQKTVISLIDAIIAKQQMQTTLVSLDDLTAASG